MLGLDLIDLCSQVTDRLMAQREGKPKPETMAEVKHDLFWNSPWDVPWDEPRL